MYRSELIRVHRMDGKMTEFPRAKLERFPMEEKRRFKLRLHSDQFFTDSDGALFVWIDRGDVSNLAFDCSTMLLEEDLEEGSAGAMELVSSS
jgi:hypothetical protein